MPLPPRLFTLCLLLLAPLACPAAPAPSSRAATHWAFQPVRPATAPATRNTTWPRNDVDRFILAKLEANQLSPSAPADRRTLIRRVTYTLTGLPPRPEDVAAFLADTSPDAYANLVDRLLASPHYGERWARHWLDIARYSDTKGYVYAGEEKRFVHSHVYRDWVVNSLNSDLPYDRFILLQIAADQLQTPAPAIPSVPAAATKASPALAAPRPDLAAMGFLTLGRRFLGVKHDIIDDRIDVVMRGFLGLTVTCARCHDHKYDPIPTRDYYSLYGIFDASTERTLPLNPAPAANPDAATVAYEKELQKRVGEFEKAFRATCDTSTDIQRKKVADYLLALLEIEKLPTEDFTEILNPNDLNPVVAREWQARLFQWSAQFHPVFGAWHALAALPADKFPALANPLAARLAAQTQPRLNPLIARALTEKPLTSMRDVAERYARVLAATDTQWRTLLQSSSKLKSPEPPVPSSPPPSVPPSLPQALPDPDAEQVRQTLYGPDALAHVPPGNINDLEFFFDEGSWRSLKKLQSEVERHLITSPAAPAHAVILEDAARMRTPQVFVRGNPAAKGEAVPRGFLQVLSGGNPRPFTQGSGRLELARAIASPDNPLTARVMVNRVWAHHFGRGLVTTPSDFGLRSEPPSHPELLDYLAHQFISQGWSLKKLHRLLLLRATYCQKSEVRSQKPEPIGEGKVISNKSLVISKENTTATPSTQTTNNSTFPTNHLLLITNYSSQSETLDPENRLLSRMNRQRLDYESMRDSLVAATGRLDLRLGGKSTDLEKRPFSTRRALYGYLDRQFVPTLLRVFDCPNPDIHTPERHATTVPQQALYFLNGPFIADMARALAARPDLRDLAPEQRIRRSYEIIFQRPPTPHELTTALRFVTARPPPASAAPTAPAKPVSTAWQYGYGEFNPATGRLKNFTPLPHFTGTAWQGGPNWPDAKLGWVQLTADGGHAGNDLAHAAIRRFIAPHDGPFTLTAIVTHDTAAGDGIRARIVSSRTGLLGTWEVHNRKIETNLPEIELKKGDTLDFLVDFRANLNNDQFTWSITLRPAPDLLGETTKTAAIWNAQKDFGGPAVPTAPPTLTPWERLTQVLLASNEFLFVD